MFTLSGSYDILLMIHGESLWSYLVYHGDFVLKTHFFILRVFNLFFVLRVILGLERELMGRAAKLKLQYLVTLLGEVQDSWHLQS